MLKLGPYGTLSPGQARWTNPHGLDLGALEPRLAEVAAHGLGAGRAGAAAAGRGRRAAARAAGRTSRRRSC